jgi:hypothetical protein
MAPINRRTTRVSRSRTPGGTGRIRRSQTNAARKNDDMPAWIPGAFERQISVFRYLLQINRGGSIPARANKWPLGVRGLIRP